MSRFFSNTKIKLFPDTVNCQTSIYDWINVFNGVGLFRFFFSVTLDWTFVTLTALTGCSNWFWRVFFFFVDDDFALAFPSFPLANYYIKHDDWFICKQCNKKYKHRTSVWRHIKWECNKKPQFACNICGKRVTQKTSLKAHVENVHGLVYVSVNYKIWQLDGATSCNGFFFWILLAFKLCISVKYYY